MTGTFYGAPNKKHIHEIIRDVCETLTPNNAPQAMQLITGTVCAETAFGTARDNYEPQGRGLAQFDRVRFDEVKAYICQRKPELNKLIVEKYGIDFSKIYFGIVIDYSPLVSIIACRVGYMMVNAPLPVVGDTEAQAKYWRRYWNSYAGKGTEEHYLKSLKHAL